MHRGRRFVAVAVLVAVATGVGLFVAVWALGDGGTEDDAGDDPTTTAADTTTTTTTAIDSVDALAEALGCAEVRDDDDSSWVPVPDVESGGCGDGTGATSAALHVAGSAEAQEDLIAYFESASQPLPPGATVNGCPGDTPEEARARGLYHLVVGDRWVVTTFTAAVADDVAARLDAAPAAFSPAPHPPASYAPGGGVCGAG